MRSAHRLLLRTLSRSKLVCSTTRNCFATLFSVPSASRLIAAGKSQARVILVCLSAACFGFGCAFVLFLLGPASTLGATISMPSLQTPTTCPSRSGSWPLGVSAGRVSRPSRQCCPTLADFGSEMLHALYVSAGGA